MVGVCMYVCVLLENTKGTQNDNDDNEDKAEENEEKICQDDVHESNRREGKSRED